MSRPQRTTRRPVQRLDRPRAFRRCTPPGRPVSAVSCPPGPARFADAPQADSLARGRPPSRDRPANAKVCSRFRETIPLYLQLTGSGDWHRVEPRLATILERWADRWGPRQLRSLGADELEAYFRALRQLGRDESDLAREQCLLRSFFSWAQRGGWTDRNPAEGLPAKNRNEPPIIAWTPVEQYLLLEAARGRFLRAALADLASRKQQGPVRRRPEIVPRYLHPAVLLALREGLLLDEVLDLRWSHLDLDDPRIRVPSVESPSGRDIDVPLAEDAERVVVEIRNGIPAEQRGEGRLLASLDLPLWRNRPDLRQVELTFRAVVRHAGIRVGDSSALQSTFLRNCAFAGVPAEEAARLCGRDPDDTTLRRIYVRSGAL